MKLTKTQKMLTEFWKPERQQAIWQAPEATLSFYEQARAGELPPEIDFTGSVHHWLNRMLRYDGGLQNRLFRFDQKINPKGEKNWFEVCNLWEIEYCERAYDAGHPAEPMRFNLASDQTYFDYTFEAWVYLHDSDNEKYDYVVLMMHLGGDVRAHYASPRCFRYDASECEIRDTSHSVYCAQDPKHLWSWDQTHWAWMGWVEPAETPLLDTCGLTTESMQPRVRSLDLTPYTLDPEQMGKGFIYIDSENNGYCPLCGGMLTPALT